MCINKYRLWDRAQKITWFHILLARNTIFPFFTVTRSPATFIQDDGPVLQYKPWPQIFAWRCSEKWMYHRFTAWFDVPSINTYNSFFQFCSRCRRLLCNCHLIFLTTLFLTLEPAQEPDCHPDSRIHTSKLGCLLPRKQSFCSKLYCIS